MFQICSGAKLGVEDKDGHTPLMIAAIERSERAFDVMVKTEEGIMVVKKTLLYLAQVSSQEGGRQTTFSEYLKVNSGIPGRCKCYDYTCSKYLSDIV